MKNTILTIVAALAVSFNASAANLGLESASSYTTATWSEGSGAGIGKWYFTMEPSTVKGISDSAQGGRVSVGSSAFNLQAGLSSQYSNAFFVFEGGALTVGQTVSLDANYLWNGGFRGIEFQAGGTSLFRAEHASDAIQFKGTDITTADIIPAIPISQNAYQRALTYSVRQVDASNVEFTASILGSATPVFSSTFAASGISQIKFYAGDTATELVNQPNYGLYFNNINVIPEPSSSLLMGLGVAGLAVLRLRRVRKNG